MSKSTDDWDRATLYLKISVGCSAFAIVANIAALVIRAVT
jgi:hypothetical protein